MRPSLIPSLVASAQKNADRGFADVALFEVGQIFKGDKPEEQVTAATGVRRALAKASGIGRHWSSKAAEVDLFDAKGDAYAALAAAGAPATICSACIGAPAAASAAYAPPLASKRPTSAALLVQWRPMPDAVPSARRTPLAAVTC